MTDTENTLDAKIDESSTDSIFRIETASANGKTAAIIAMNAPFNEHQGIGRDIIERLQKVCAPTRLIKEGGLIARGEVANILRDMGKVIILDMEPGPGIKEAEKDAHTSEQMNFPEVLYWSETLGIPPNVVLKGAAQLDFSMGALMEQLGYE